MSSPNHSAIPASETVLPDNARKQLISLAYGYMGSLAEAEDIVQESLLRLEQSSRNEIENIEAWLTTLVTRLAIDRLRSARHRREIYPGEWLPEPVYREPDAEQKAITRSRLSVGLLYLLERLEPEQRIVFVLREVFDYPYRSIATLAGKTEAACRQLMARARTAIGRVRQTPPENASLAALVLERFLTALALGDERELLAVLSPDAILVGDGGGKVSAIVNPLSGAERIIRFFLGLHRKFGGLDHLEPALVNAGPGMQTFRDGQLSSVTSVAIEDGRITAIYYVSNPDKL